MRLVGRRKAKRAGAKAAKPDLYAQYGKKAPTTAAAPVSFASYDDLFGVKANSDAVDWAELEDDLDSLSTATTKTTASRKSKKSSPFSRISRRSSKLSRRSSKHSRRSSKSTVSSASATPPPPDLNGFSDDDDDDGIDADSMSVASHSSFSQASFEEVFGRRVFDDDDLDGEFQFTNPTSWRDNTATKEAVYDVLTKGGSTMQMARKLFLLEHLNRPAPPSEPPGFWMRSGVFGPRPRRKRVKGFYEIPGSAADVNGITPELFWSFADIIGQSAKLHLGWPVRVDVLLDASRLVGKLHQASYTHGSLRADNLLLDDNMHVYLRTVKTIGPLTKAEARGEERENKMKLDIFGFGVVILELAAGKSFSKMECPKLRSAVKLEEKKRIDQLEELGDDVDAEVRAILVRKGLDVPMSLVELCAQCVSPFRMNRPEADDVIGWLQDLREDMQDAKTPERSSVARGLIGNKSVKLKPAKIYDMAKVDVIDEEGLEDGYETDDSYAPPEGAEEAGITLKSQNVKAPPPAPPRKTNNKLQAFLGATGDTTHLHGAGSSAASVAGDGKQRPRSMMLPSGLKGMFDEENLERGSGKESGDGTKVIKRRRSLDRGYYYARSRLLASDDKDHKELISKANIAKFKEVVRAKQATLSPKAIDPEKLAQRFDEQDILSNDEALAIIKRTDTVLRKEPNLIQLNTNDVSHVTVVGDIHGQYYDLRNLIRLAGQPGKGKGKTTYLFLGDYVDRGDWGAEVLLYLFALKARYPEHVWLLRGNHEARAVSSFFGFKEECEKKYGLTFYNRACDAFQAMPIAATVNTPSGKFLCLHGGISPNVQELHQFVEFDRFQEPAMNGFLCDVLWSDPVKDSHEDGADQSLSDFLNIDFLSNPQRGCSFRYGFKALVNFLAKNKLVALIRAHEVQEEGYLFHFQDLTGGAKENANVQVTPPVITVFSAPNYCGRYGNMAAFIRIHNKPQGRRLKRSFGVRPIQLLEPVQFTAVTHPDPIITESEKERQSVRIETTIPYMPSTFDAFIKRAIELGEEEARRALQRKASKQQLMKGTNRHASLDRKAAPPIPTSPVSAKGPAPPLPPRRANSGSVEESDGEGGTGDKAKGSKNWKAAQLLGFEEDARDHKAAGKKKKANKKYTEAAASDGINEMNPLVVQDKMKEAQTKLNPDQLHLPGTVRIQDGNRRRSLIKNKDIGEHPHIDNPDIAVKGKSEGGDAITFTNNELLALQMLFLIVDHRDKGYITAADLVQWSAEDGVAVRKSEAELCINYVDVDFDGKIGFEDYLVFAAKNKERWLIAQYDKVVSHIKRMQKQASSPGLVE